jgi:hypothetical protein
VFTTDEIEAAFAHFQAEVVLATQSGDWTHFTNLFTEDADYYEHSYGHFSGRDQITTWAIKTMTTFPGSAMPGFPVAWYVIDEARGWVVCEIRNIMRDPGDGTVFEATNITILHYAGNNTWSYEEDVYNPAKFFDMVSAWAVRCRELGTLDADTEAWLARYAPAV